MTINPHKNLSRFPVLEVSRLNKVNQFDYLGLRIDSRPTWAPQIKNSKVIISHRSATVAKHLLSSYSKAISPALIVYRARAQTDALYGAEICGFFNGCDLAIAENRFLRAILGLPISTPLPPIYFDLALKKLAYLAMLRPLVYWIRLWSVPEILVSK